MENRLRYSGKNLFLECEDVERRVDMIITQCGYGKMIARDMILWLWVDDC